MLTRASVEAEQASSASGEEAGLEREVGGKEGDGRGSGMLGASAVECFFLTSWVLPVGGCGGRVDGMVEGLECGAGREVGAACARGWMGFGRIFEFTENLRGDGQGARDPQQGIWVLATRTLESMVPPGSLFVPVSGLGFVPDARPACV